MGEVIVSDIPWGETCPRCLGKIEVGQVGVWEWRRRRELGLIIKRLCLFHKRCPPKTIVQNKRPEKNRGPSFKLRGIR